MRPFLVDSRSKSVPDLEHGEWRIWITPRYYEWEFPSFNNDGTHLVIYLLPRNQTSLTVVACWERIFNGWLEVLGESQEVRKEVERSWPIFSQILLNTLNKKYSAGVLTLLEDPDTVEEKFFLASVLGNVDAADPMTWGERGNEIIRYLGGLSLLLLEELSTKKLSGLRVFRDSAWQATKDTLFGLLREYVADHQKSNISSNAKQGSQRSLRKPPIFEYFENLRRK